MRVRFPSLSLMKKDERKEMKVDDVAKIATDIVLAFDKLDNNPDRNLIETKILNQLQEDGYVSLTVFACLDWATENLKSEIPERFMAETTRNEDLFMPRVPKLSQLQEKLSLQGIVSKLNIVLGDTDVEDYFQLILEAGGLRLDNNLLKMREERYINAFKQRINRTLKPNVEVITWSELADLYSTEVVISEDLIKAEVESMKQSYLNSANFSVFNLKISDEIFIAAAKKKINLYANQGRMVNGMLQGILLQTETPWLLRTRMLKLLDNSLCVIYPWIRKEELDNI